MQPRPRSEAPPRIDVYLGMLAVALGSLMIACVLLFVDYANYPSSKPSEPPPPETIKNELTSAAGIEKG